MTRTTTPDVPLATIVEEHQRHVWSYLRVLGCDPVMADDLTQETFLALLKAKTPLRDPQAAGAYLRKAARSVFARSARRYGASPGCPIDELEQTEQVWMIWHRDGDDGGGVIDALRECLDHLPGTARKAIAMQYEDQLDGATIASRLGIGHSNVRVTVHRARQSLRDCVERKAGIR